ncbi:MAG TPA: signal peptidase I [Symbiobacteriaceae bacterium]|nr:signal peptidase I [Symbiobacteriaceae bacterium]
MTPGSDNPLVEQEPKAQSETPASPPAATAAGVAQDAAGQAGEIKKPGKSPAREWAETLVVALLVALVIRTFVVQVYLVEGPSMEPTLHTNERVFVNKLIYRFRAPKPGEIIVLQDPNRPQRELIKRVIAVAGETIEIKKGTVFVNGQALKEPFINTAIVSSTDMRPLTVPDKQVFVMGDNRGMSFDSRAIGPIAVNKIDGKAFFMFWPIDKFAYGPLDQPRQMDQTRSTTK